MEDSVSYEQAKRLKELGFDWKTHAWYNTHGELWTKCPQAYPAPTLAQVQKWLREVKEIFVYAHISVGPRVKGKHYWIITSKDGEVLDSIPFVKLFQLFDSYEQALSAGIDKALEILKQQSNGNKA